MLKKLREKKSLRKTKVLKNSDNKTEKKEEEKRVFVNPVIR